MDTSAAQTFTIMVTPVNDPPTGSMDPQNLYEDASATITLAGADIDGTPKGLVVCDDCGGWRGDCLDPNPTFKGSVKYSVRRLFITANDDGRDVPNWSGLLGRLFSESLANVYWPDEDRDAAHTFRRYGEDLGTVIGTNMLRNYWPVFFKKLRHGNK